MFALQNGMVIGIFTNEYGLFSPLAPTTNDTAKADAISKDGRGHTLAIKNTNFGLAYFALLIICVRSVIRAVVDGIIACC